MIARLEGWEARLADVFKEASMRPYDARTWNCAKFTHLAAEVVSGRHIPFRWHGSLEASADAVLPRIDPLQARRGDVVLYLQPAPTLGLCLGRTAVFVGPSGLDTIPMSQVVAAWSV